MTDKSYFQLRAETQARLATTAQRSDVRSIHEELSKRYLQQAGTAQPARQLAG